MIYEVNTVEPRIRAAVARVAARRGLQLNAEAASLRDVAASLRRSAEDSEAAYRRYLEFVLR